MTIYPAWLRHDLRDLACWVALASLLANFLPNASWVHDLFHKWPRVQARVDEFYAWFIDMVAFIALNWRICLPSMDFKFFGFARTVKHAVRNWKQDRQDKLLEEK